MTLGSAPSGFRRCPVTPRNEARILQIAADLGLTVVACLGEGAFGAAYLLDDGAVFKVTADDTEIEPVERIHHDALDEETPHLPFFDQFGAIDPPNAFPVGKEGDLAVFYSVREALDDPPDHFVRQWNVEDVEGPWRAHIRDILADLKRLGIHVMDINPLNWGTREDGTLVLRDPGGVFVSRR